MLSINTIARIEVNVVRASSQPTSFDTGLLLVKDASFAAAKRLKSYASSAEAAAGLVADGFASSTEAYKAAQKYFAASPSPGRLLVSCNPASESPAQALDAVLDITSDFYGVALADNPDKLPQTDDASAQFMNVFSSVLIGYTNRGVLTTAPWRGTAVGSIQAGDYIENDFYPLGGQL